MTEIHCGCGASRLEEIMCAECGEYYRAGWIPGSDPPKETCEVWVKALGMTKPELGSFVARISFSDFVYSEPCFYVWRAGDWTSKVIVTHWMPLPEPPTEA